MRIFVKEKENYPIRGEREQTRAGQKERKSTLMLRPRRVDTHKI